MTDTSLRILHLIIPRHNIRIRRRHTPILLLSRRPRSIATLLRAIVHRPIILPLRLALLLVPMVLNNHIRDTPAALAVVLGNGLVLVGRLGVLCDDVPGVQEAGDDAEDAEEDVDDGVGGADAALDPDCEGVLAVCKD